MGNANLTSTDVVMRQSVYVSQGTHPIVNASNTSPSNSLSPFTTWKLIQLRPLIPEISFQLSSNKNRRGSVINVRTVVKRKKVTSSSGEVFFFFPLLSP